MNNEENDENPIIESTYANFLTTNALFFSSFIFITNTIYAYYKKYYIYSLLFAFLTIASSIHHLKYTIYTNVFDKIAIYLIVFYSSYIFYNKLLTNKINWFLNLLIATCFLLTVFLYSYGYCSKKYCFDKELCVRNKYHSFMHVVGSIGHNCIIFL